MELEYKADIDVVRERWAAFWREESPRPLLHVIQAKRGVEPIRKPRPYDCAFAELDPIIDQALGWAASHDFLADSIPSFMITFAPDHFAALLGAEIKCSEEGQTNWVEPCLTSLDDVEIVFQRNGYWWKRTVATWGSLNRFGMYSAAIIDVPQCDVSCMISPDMFNTFEIPSLIKEIECTAASIYHLDGPDAL